MFYLSACSISVLLANYAKTITLCAMTESAPKFRLNKNTQAEGYAELFDLTPEYEKTFSSQRAEKEFPCLNDPDKFAIDMAGQQLSKIKAAREDCLGCPRQELCLLQTLSEEHRPNYASPARLAVGVMMAGGTTPSERTSVAKWVTASMKESEHDPKNQQQQKSIFLGTLHVQLLNLSRGKQPILRDER